MTNFTPSRDLGLTIFRENIFNASCHARWFYGIKMACIKSETFLCTIIKLLKITMMMTNCMM